MSSELKAVVFTISSIPVAKRLSFRRSQAHPVAVKIQQLSPTDQGIVYASVKKNAKSGRANFSRRLLLKDGEKAVR